MGDFLSATASCLTTIARRITIDWTDVWQFELGFAEGFQNSQMVVESGLKVCLLSGHANKFCGSLQSFQPLKFSR